MAESIGTARLDIVVDTSSLDAGVNKAKRSTQDMAKTAQDASQKMDAGTKRQVQSIERQIATLGKSRAEVIKWRIEQQTSGRVAAELSAKLDAQSAKLAASSRTFDRMGASAKRLAATWVALGAAAATAAVSFGVKNAIDFADKLNDINIRLGISAEALSGWAFAAQQTGTDIDGLGVGLRRLAKNMAEAQDATSSQGRVFAALGVNVKDAQGNLRRMEDVLPDIASKFKSIQNETLKAALAQEVFGKSGADLIEFLNQGADGLEGMRDRARELGVELSQDTLTSADKFKDTLSEMKSAAQGLFTQLAQALLPEMTKLAEKLTEVVSDGDRTKQFVENLSTVVAGTARVFEFAAGQIAVMINQLAALKTAAEGVITLDWSQINRGLAMGLAGQAQAGENLRRFAAGSSASSSPEPEQERGVDFSLGAPMTDKEREAFERRVAGSLAGTGAGAKKAKKEGKTDAERELERLEAAYKSLAAQQRERIALFGVEGEAAKVRYELEHGELSKLTDAQAKKLGINKEELIANAERLDQLREEAEVQKELDRINEARTERVKTVLDDIKTETELLGKSIGYQDTYNKLKYAGVDANSAFGQSIIEANQAFHEQAKATERQIELMDTFRTEASSAISDVVTGTKSLSDAFKDMFDNIAERITQMIAERWIEQLFGETGTSGGGSQGDWIGQIFSIFASAKGNVFAGGAPVQAFASGGVVSSPTFFPMTGSRIGLMGEAGPEAIVPLARGKDGKLGIRMDGEPSRRGDVSVVQNIHVQGHVDPRTRSQLRADAAREQSRALSRNQ